MRLHAHRGKDHYFDSFADAGVRAIWRAAAELGLIVELHIGPNYAAQAGEAIAAFPSVPVLIDHLGEPQFGTPVEYAEMLDLARFTNVWMKLSGVGYISSDRAAVPGCQAVRAPVADAFGPDRLCWGGGTPEIVDAQLDHFSAAERAQVKGGNLARLLEVDPVAPSSGASSLAVRAWLPIARAYHRLCRSSAVNFTTTSSFQHKDHRISSIERRVSHGQRACRRHKDFGHPAGDRYA